MFDLRWVSGGLNLRPPCERSAQLCEPPTLTAGAVHHRPWGSHDDTSAPPAVGQASSPAATPAAHAAGTNSASAHERLLGDARMFASPTCLQKVGEEG